MERTEGRAGIVAVGTGLVTWWVRLPDGSVKRSEDAWDATEAGRSAAIDSLLDELPVEVG